MEIRKKGTVNVKAYALLIGFMILVMSLVSAIGCPSPETSTAPIEIKLSTVAPSTHPDFSWWEQWGQEVEEKTDGKVEFTVYPAGTLCSPLEIYTAVESGLADMAVAPTNYASAHLRLNMFVGQAMWGLGSSQETSSTYNTLRDRVPELNAEFDDVHLIWVYGAVPTVMNSTVPIHTPDDYKGLTVRMSPGWEAVGQAWGASPISMPVSEIYVSLEKGTMDGYMGGVEMLKSMSLYEFIDYVMLHKLNAWTGWAAMNQDTWDSLPKDVQNVINDMTEQSYASFVVSQDEAAQVNLAFAEESGIEIFRPDAEQLAQFYAVAEPALQRIVADLESKGYSANKVLSELEQLGAH